MLFVLFINPFSLNGFCGGSKDNPAPTTDVDAALTEIKNLTPGSTAAQCNASGTSSAVAPMTSIFNPTKLEEIVRECCNKEKKWHDRCIESINLLKGNAPIKNLDNMESTPGAIATWIKNQPPENSEKICSMLDAYPKLRPLLSCMLKDSYNEQKQYYDDWVALEDQSKTQYASQEEYSNRTSWPDRHINTDSSRIKKYITDHPQLERSVEKLLRGYANRKKEFLQNKGDASTINARSNYQREVSMKMTESFCNDTVKRKILNLFAAPAAVAPAAPTVAVASERKPPLAPAPRIPVVVAATTAASSAASGSSAASSPVSTGAAAAAPSIPQPSAASSSASNTVAVPRETSPLEAHIESLISLYQALIDKKPRMKEDLADIVIRYETALCTDGKYLSQLAELNAIQNKSQEYQNLIRATAKVIRTNNTLIIEPNEKKIIRRIENAYENEALPVKNSFDDLIEFTKEPGRLYRITAPYGRTTTGETLYQAKLMLFEGWKPDQNDKRASKKYQELLGKFREACN
ncbi:MAG: hypothetical protein HQK53_03500 [Oligoflexia bacterium]|nr:hypothetical protein [Oligoflexia bacterium]